ncbi:MAG: PKD domain-containing protein [Planctomycetota bacterium]
MLRPSSFTVSFPIFYLAGLLLAAPAMAQTLVKDLNPGLDTVDPGGSGPQQFAVGPGFALFSAADAYGGELWRTDGTTAGTQRVGDLAIGSASSSPTATTYIDGTWFFAASSPGLGQELWVSDGTLAGSHMVADLRPGQFSSSPRNFVAAGAVVFFTADDGTSGNELWRTDGTALGTFMIADIVPGPTGSSLKELTAFGSRILFTAQTSTSGIELWVSDGTAAGTMLLVDLNPASSSPTELVAFDGKVYFSAIGASGRELWRTDGTAAGTVQVADIEPGPGSSSPTGLTVVGSQLFFAATTAADGQELWKTDGVSTVQVTSLVVGAGSSSPRNLTAMGGLLLFSAQVAGTGREPYVSDGTSSGTILLADSAPGSASGFSAGMTAVGARAFFSANDGVDGIELWVTDGTPSGTAMVIDLAVGVASSSPVNLTAFQGEVMFGANDRVTGQELWISDGTAAGTRLVKDITVSYAGSSPQNLLEINGKLFFTASSPGLFAEPWVSDGTAAGTMLLADINPGEPGSSVFSPVQVGTQIIFRANNGSTGHDLWRTDGTPAGTRMVIDLPFTPSGFHAYGDSVLFSNSTTRELWITDGTAAGTVPLVVLPGIPVYLGHLNGTVIFSINVGGAQIWKTDGTVGGTVHVTDLPFSARGGGGVVGNELIFGTGFDIRATDGTAAGTRLVLPSDPYRLTAASDVAVLDGILYFPGSDQQDLELWRTDGTETGTWRVADINPGTAIGTGNPLSSSPADLRVANGRLFFTADDGIHGRELWSSDGTTAGTLLLGDLFPAGSAAPMLFDEVSTAGELLFAGYDEAGGLEPWVSDGTVAGTRRLADITPGPLDSRPGEIRRAGGVTFVSATDPLSYGRELFRIDSAAVDQTAPIADAGPDQAIHAGAIVSLNGSGSSDDTTTLANLTFAWTLVGAPVGSAATIAGATTPTPVFNADLPGTYTARLVVTDEARNASTPDDVVVSSLNLAPTANAGSDGTTVVGRASAFDGSASYDADLDPLTYAWTLVAAPSGSSSMLIGATTVMPVLTPDVAGTYVLDLVVDDGFVASVADQVELVAVSASDFALGALDRVRATIDARPESAFDAPGHRHSLLNQIARIAKFIQRGDLDQARAQLDDLISRIDGVSLRSEVDPKGGGQPFAADFVVDPVAQVAAYSDAVLVRGAIAP